MSVHTCRHILKGKPYFVAWLCWSDKNTQMCVCMYIYIRFDAVFTFGVILSLNSYIYKPMCSYEKPNIYLVIRTYVDIYTCILVCNCMSVLSVLGCFLRPYI